ncbi:hypothetical protein BDR06DRAFT_960869 [Suillus hirtellus]|nr:hypothetical protein BDR06DRAFT_960869 [Suillus hirtellus]
MIIKLRGLSLFCTLLSTVAVVFYTTYSESVRWPRPACKVPCRITRLLDERCCPLHAVAHTTSGYLIYDDALDYHPLCFESVENLCSWLS